MHRSTVALVTTTIHVPQLLFQYLENAAQNGRIVDAVIVVGDLSTPAETAVCCEQLAQQYPAVIVEYYDQALQEHYLESFPKLREHLPWKSIQRRNIGILRAYEMGMEVIVTIDDDNFVVEQDYFGQLSILGTTVELPTVSTETGWYNVCEELRTAQAAIFYHRGYPFNERAVDRQPSAQWSRSTRRVSVVAGFWLGDPDIDAVQRIAHPIDVQSYHRTGPFALGSGVWSPFNSQNTALHRSVIPAYFLSPFIGRYDDIWASYVVRRIADQLGDAVVYGPPLVRQERNPHNVWKDLEEERMGMEVTDLFCEWLRGVSLHGASYSACVEEVIAAARLWSPSVLARYREAFVSWVDGYELWQMTVQRLASK